MLSSCSPTDTLSDVGNMSNSKHTNSLYNETANQEIGNTTVKLIGDRETVRISSTNLGNLTADAIKSYTSADIAIIQSGAIRNSIETGAIKGSDVLKALPFDNRVMTIEATGAKIKEALENAVSAYPELDGRFPQVSGITFKFSPDAPFNSRVSDIMFGNTKLDSEKTYTLAINDYIFGGGDMYNMFENCTVLNRYNDTFAGVLIKYLC